MAGAPRCRRPAAGSSLWRFRRGAARRQQPRVRLRDPPLRAPPGRHDSARHAFQPRNATEQQGARMSIHISLMLAVEDATEAAAWYKRALGAHELWSLGSVVGLEIEGVPFSLHEPHDGLRHPGKYRRHDRARRSLRRRPRQLPATGDRSRRRRLQRPDPRPPGPGGEPTVKEGSVTPPATPGSSATNRRSTHSPAEPVNLARAGQGQTYASINLAIQELRNG